MGQRIRWPRNASTQWQSIVARCLFHLDRHYILYAAVLVTGYALALAWLYHGPSAVPDEHWFRNAAHAAQPEHTWASLLRGIFRQRNELAYGALYWLLYRAAVVLCADPLGAMRLLSLVCFVLIPACLLFSRWKETPAQKAMALGLALLWLGFPAAWWTGKITAPEPLAMALVCLALVRLQRRASAAFSPWFLLGVAVGLKLTCVPAVVFALSVSAPSWWWRLQRVSCIGFSLLGGFVFANPFLLTPDAHYFVEIVQALSKSQSLLLTIRAIPNLFTSTYWTWDLAPGNGFFGWALAPLPLAVFAVWCAFGGLPRKATFALVVSFASSVAMLAHNPIFYGWYWFPTLVVVLASFLWTKTHTKHHVAWLFALVLLNGASQASITAFNIRMRKDHDALLIRNADLQLTLREALIAAEPVQFVCDLTDVSFPVDFSFLQEPSTRKVTYVNALFSAHYAAGMLPPQPLCGKGVVVTGQRFLRHPAVGPVAQWMPTVLPTFSVSRSDRAGPFTLDWIEGPCDDATVTFMREQSVGVRP